MFPLQKHLCVRVPRAMRDCMAIVLLVTTLFGTGLFVVALMFMLSPINRLSPPWWYMIDNTLWGPMWAILVLYTEVFGGLRLVFSGDTPVIGESMLVISNHVSELDFIVILALAARMDGTLPAVRFIAKAALAKLPILGQGLYLHHTIFIRSRPEGRAQHTSAAERVKMRARYAAWSGERRNAAAASHAALPSAGSTRTSTSGASSPVPSTPCSRSPLSSTAAAT